jgi:hypothetical protein
MGKHENLESFKNGRQTPNETIFPDLKLIATVRQYTDTKR